MNKEKQIEEMTGVLRHSCENECFKNKDGFTDCEACEACLLYEAGYRKQNVGEWIESYSYGVWHYECPFCKDGYAVEEREKSPENFCNNCGAKLDGARMEENV